MVDNRNTWARSTSLKTVVTPDGTEVIRALKSDGTVVGILSGSIADADAAAAIAAHVALSDPHTQYLKESDATAGYQPLDSDLTAIAALTPSNDDIVQRKAGAWTNRTPAQLIADLAALGTTFQPLDSDLTAIAALSTTSFGRSVLDRANAAALATLAGVGTGDSPQFTAINLGHASDTTLTRSASGRAAVEGVDLALDTFLQSGTGAVTRTPQAKARDAVSALDFIPVAEHAAIAAGTSTTQVATYIQAALDAHDAVFLPAGDYYIDGATLEPNAGQRIYGPGRLKKVTPVGGYTSPYILVDSVADVEIVGVGFYGPLAREHGVRVHAATDVLVERCRFNERGQAVDLGCTPVVVWKNSKNVRVINNTIFGGQQGVASGGDSAGNTDGQITGVLIANNYFEDCDEEAVDVNWHTHSCAIVGNTIVGCGVDNVGGEAIDVGGSVDGTGSKCRDVAIVGNTIIVDQTAEFGIQIKQWTEGATIVGNTIRATTTAAANRNGIALSNVRGATVRGNHVEGFRYSVGLGSTSTDVAIDGNTLQGPEFTGIECTGTSQTYVSITNNVIDGLNAASSFGIDLANTTLSVISGNIIRGFTSDDAIIAQSTSSHLTIADNDLSHCDTGVFCLANHSRVSGNRCYDHVAQGIRIQGDYIQTIGNMVVDCMTGSGGSYGITMASGSDDCVMSHNTITDTRGGSALQRGIQFIGACARAVVVGNRVYPFLTAAFAGLTNLDATCIVKDNYFGQTLGLTTVTSDAAFTLTAQSNSWDQLHTGTLTADRAVTLSTTNARNGDKFRITRTGAGAFNLNIGTGPLKALATNTWCEVTYNGSAWVLTAYGAL